MPGTSPERLPKSGRQPERGHLTGGSHRPAEIGRLAESRRQPEIGHLTGSRTESRRPPESGRLAEKHRPAVADPVAERVRATAGGLERMVAQAAAVQRERAEEARKLGAPRWTDVFTTQFTEFSNRPR